MSNEKYHQIMMKAYRHYSEGCARKLIKSPTYQKFISLCRTEPDFRERCGLVIEERALSLAEKLNAVSTIIGEEGIRTHEDNLARVDKLNIPTKHITIIYGNERLESYF